jgi:hypothetical protein
MLQRSSVNLVAVPNRYRNRHPDIMMCAAMVMGYIVCRVAEKLAGVIATLDTEPLNQSN